MTYNLIFLSSVKPGFHISVIVVIQTPISPWHLGLVGLAMADFNMLKLRMRAVW